MERPMAGELELHKSQIIKCPVDVTLWRERQAQCIGVVESEM